MRRLIATTAVALVLAGPTLAQDQTAVETDATETQTMAAGGFYTAESSDFLAANLMGAEVYAPQSGAGGDATATDATAEAPVEGETEATADATAGGDTGAATEGEPMMAGGSGPVSQDELNTMENIGSVDDLVLDARGDLQAVVIDVGGFLGIGSRVVALSGEELEVRRGQDDPSAIYVISRVGADTLENAPEFDRSVIEEQQTAQADTGAAPVADEPMADDTVAQDPAVQDPAAQDPAMAEGGDAWRGDREPMTAPQMQREGYAMAEATQFTADNLMGAAVYDINDENIGSVSDVVLTQDGQLDAVVIDVGGFLGLGAHTVAIGIDEMTILQADDGSDLRAYVDVTQEQLESMPEFEEQAG